MHPVKHLYWKLPSKIAASKRAKSDKASTPSSFRYALVRTGALLTCGTLIFTAATASASGVPQKKLTPLQQGINFYRGKTIEYIAPTAAGSANDVISRAISKEIGTYLGATINVVNISAGQSVPGQNAIAGSAPNGLTIGFLNTGSDYYDLLTNQSGVNFNLKQMAFLGGTPNTVPVIATQSTSPYTSFANLLRDTATVPAKDLIVSGAAASQAVLVLKTFGIHVQYVSGYANSSAQVVGFLRGDGNLIVTGVAQLLSEITTGSTRVLAIDSVTQKPPRDMGDYSTIQSIPTVPELLTKYPPKTAAEKKALGYARIVSSVPNIVFAAPSATPSDLVDALVEAVKFGLRSTYFKTQILAVGNLTGYVRPTVDKYNLVKALGGVSKIGAF